MLYVTMETLSHTNNKESEEYSVGTPITAYEFFISTCKSLTNIKSFKGWKVCITNDDKVLFVNSNEHNMISNKDFQNKLMKWAYKKEVKHDRRAGNV